MSIDVGRLRPDRRTAVAVVAVLWAMSAGAVRDLVWADVREGVLRLDVLPRGVRTAARAGFVLLAGVLLLLLAGEALRGGSPLLGSPGEAGTGGLVPRALVPLVTVVVVVAWAFLLAGALHAHPLLRVVVVVAYVALTSVWVDGPTGFPVHQLLLLAAVPAVFLLRARRASRPVPELLVLLLVVATTYAAAQSALLADEGPAAAVTRISLTTTLLTGLVLPLLVLVGLDVAEFTIRLSTWTAQTVATRVPALLTLGLLLALLAWRGVVVAGDLLTRGGPSAGGYLGALGTALLVAAAWWLTVGRAERAGEDAPEALGGFSRRHGVLMALGYVGVQAVVTLGLCALLAVSAVRGEEGVSDWLLGAAGTLMRLTSAQSWALGFDVVLLVAAVVLMRRGLRLPALYVGLVAALHAWAVWTDRGGLLDAGDVAALELWVVLGFWALVGRWVLRGGLTPERVQGLLVLVVLALAVRSATLVADPFSPVFAFAGAGFIVFGIVWDVLTSGSWANEGTPALPRPSRLLLYLGYVLVTAVVVLWAVVSHDVDAYEVVTDGAGAIGFERLGRPLVYAVFAVLLAAAVRGRPVQPQDGLTRA